MSPTLRAAGAPPFSFPRGNHRRPPPPPRFTQYPSVTFQKETWGTRAQMAVSKRHYCAGISFLYSYMHTRKKTFKSL